MTLESGKKDHVHHHKPGHHHHHHGSPPKPETGTTQDSHDVSEHGNLSINIYANDELRALREELEMETKMRYFLTVIKNYYK